MHRARLPLLLVLVCVALPVAVAGSSPGSQVPVRHQDPATVAVDADPGAAFGWYLDALARFASWRFSEGRRLMVRLDQASLPPEFRSVIRELNQLIVKEGSILEAADGWLREAAALLDAGKVEAARPLLEQLSRYVRRGEVLFDDLVAGFQELGKRSGVEALAPDAPNRRAHDELQRLAARARAMLAAYGAVARDPGSVAALGRLLPHPTELVISVPLLAYPGRPFAISGTVTERAPVPSKGRVLTLRLDDQTLAEFPLGPFSQEVTLPSATLPGARTVVVEVPPQGRYLGAQARGSVRVIQAVPDLRVRVPGRAVAPGRLEISGAAISGLGPAARAEVRARLGPALGVARTADDGAFTLALDLPGTLGLVGTEQISLRLLPAEPWHADAGLVVSVFVVNLVNAGLASALLLLGVGLAYVGFGRTAGRRPSASGPRPGSATGEDVRAAPAFSADAIPDLSALTAEITTPEAALRQALLYAYREALRAVQKATGLTMKPSTTLREFAQQAGPALGGAAHATFLGITGLAERALYSSHPLSADLVDEALRLGARLGEELRLARS